MANPTKEELMRRLAEMEAADEARKKKNRQSVRAYREKMQEKGRAYTTVFLAGDLKARLEEIAQDTGQTISDLINRYLRRGLEADTGAAADPEPPQEETDRAAIIPRDMAEIRGSFPESKGRLISWITEEREKGRPWPELAEELNRAEIRTQKGKPWNDRSIEAFHRRNR